MKNLGHHSLKTKALSLLMAVLMIFMLLPSFAAVAAGEIAELRAAVVFSTTAPKSGDEFFMDIRVNSASLGGDGNLIEDLCVAFDLPANLSVAAEPEPFGSEFTVSVAGSHVEVNWNDTVPVGAPSQLRFILAWNAGVTVEGDDEWVDPEIKITATECVGAYATDQDGISAVQSVYPKNNSTPEHMTTEYQNVYAALLHIATVKIKSENSSGGLNMYGGTVTIEMDSAAYIAGIKHNNASIPFAEIDDTPSAGRKTIVIELPDSSLEVNGGWNAENTIQIIYNYPPDTTDDSIPEEYDMYITLEAERENGEHVSETDNIHEEINYRVGDGPGRDLFKKIAPAEFVRANANPLSWIIGFDPFADVHDVEAIDDPLLNEPDFFDGFRFSRVEVTAYDPVVDTSVPLWENVGRTRVKLYYQHTGDTGVWYAVPSSEVTATGANQYSWSGTSLTSASLGLGADYVTKVKIEYYDTDGVSRDIPGQSGDVQVRLFATATADITDNTSNSYNDDDEVTNTLTAVGTLISTPFDLTGAEAITADTGLTSNLPTLTYAYHGDDWYYADGGTNPGVKDDNCWGPSASGSWNIENNQGEWSADNSAGGGTGFVRIGDEAWIVEKWLITGGYFNDPIVYFYVPDPNIEIVGVETGRVISYSDVEYFDTIDGGHIVKFRIKNEAAWIPGNPAEPSDKSVMPAFGVGDPGAYEYEWGHWWVRHDEVAIKVKFNPGAKDSSVSGNIWMCIVSGDPNQMVTGGNSGALSAIPYGNKVTEADTNAAGSEQGWYRYFPYSIDRTVGLNSIAKVSQDDSSYTQTKTIDNSSSPVDVYLRMSVENPLSENYGTLSKIRLIDMLPYSGDTMAISNSPKNSTGSLTGYEVYSVKVNDAEILFADLAAAGIQLYYSNSANFMTNRQELRNVTVSAAGHWTQLASANGIPNTAKAIMAEKDNFVSGDTLEIILKAAAPASSDTNKYWHSVAAGGRYGANNIVPGEPTKSGFTGLGGNPVTVSGRVWNDTNQDGVQDVGETGYQGLIMTLYDDQGNEADVTETGSNGEYSFTDDFDASSSWHIQFTLPDDYALTQYHAPAATASTNSDYSLYQGTPTVFYSFGAVTEDKINLDAGIYNTAVDYYTVTYHVNTPSGATGGSVPSAITGIESGDSAQLSAATAVPTRTDGSGTYSFKGWSTTVNPALDATIDYAGTGQIASVTDDVNLYAVWVFTATYWNLAYDVNLPSGAEQPSTVITLPTAQNNIPTGTASTATGSPTGVPVRTDGTGFYTFNGWKTAANGGDSYTAAQTVPAQSAGTTITLYAQWAFTNTYTVTYHANTPYGAESGTVPDALTNIPAGSSAQLSPAITVPTKSGGKYEFKGWSLTLDPELDADIDFAGNAVINPVDQDYDLYAVWTWKKNPAGAGTNSKDDDTKPSPTPGGVIFSDEHYAYVVGYPDGEVKPQNNITRAEVTTVFFRLLTEQNRSSNWRETNTYSDVNANDWFNNAVSVMSGMKVVNGYPDGSFKPNANISRAEVAVIAARFARQLGTGKTNTTAFSDIDGHWAKNDILFAASVGWINGYPDGTFEPDQPLTRAEFIALANRMLERAPEYEGDLLDNMVKWRDNADKTAWYYLDVQEATNSHTYTRKMTLVPKLLFKYERWELITNHKDWTLLER